MKGIFTTLVIGLACQAVAGRMLLARDQSQPVAVDPADLARRADLIGKDIIVDDRVTYYVFHSGRGYDEVKLKKADAVFRLPPGLRPAGSPGTKPVVIQGRLRREGSELVVDVTSLRVMPDDPLRLDQAIATLGPRDVEGRKAWAAWAEKRSKDYGDKDGVLAQRAETLRTEALRLEADQTRGAVDAPAEWLALAEKARRQGIPEPEPGALVHRALRARLKAAANPGELEQIQTIVEQYFPNAAKDYASGRANVASWAQAYAEDPYGTYRNPKLPGPLRKTFDRRLWADAVEKRMEMEAQRDPVAAMNLAPRAEAELPDRPELAQKLLNKGLEAARQNVGNLRGDEVRLMGTAYREKLHDPEAEKELYRTWLKAQRERLSDTDADGPVDLAARYEELLGDRATAKELLERAWKIDPGSKQIAEAFRTRGYQRKGDAWVEAVPNSEGADAGAPSREDAPSPLTRGLRGRTPDEVVQLLGSKPDSKILSATKGQLVEQWIFHLPARKDRYVNFLHTAGDIQPRVISDRILESSRSRDQ